jgi:hypothetical protein
MASSPSAQVPFPQSEIEQHITKLTNLSGTSVIYSAAVSGVDDQAEFVVV